MPCLCAAAATPAGDSIAQVATIVAAGLSSPAADASAALPAGAAVDVVIVQDAQDACGDADCACVDGAAGQCAGAEEQCGCECCQSAPEPAYEFFGPQAVVNQHPPDLLFYSPVPETATTLAPGRRNVIARLEWTNLIIRELDSGIIADYDFETLRPSLTCKWGTPAGEISASLPFIYRSHGILDGPIADWHKFFGFTNGLRNIFPDQQYRFTIVTREGLVFNDQGDTYGLGDLSLGLKRELFNRGDGQKAIAVRAGFKAPLGDPDKALGSGNWDASVGTVWQRQFGARWRGYAAFDWVFVGKPDWQHVGHQDIFITNYALEYALRHNLTLTSQFRTQRNPLRIGSHQADKDAQELSVGFNHRVRPDLVWSGGFNEDINPETAPDFVINTQLKWEF